MRNSRRFSRSVSGQSSSSSSSSSSSVTYAGTEITQVPVSDPNNPNSNAPNAPALFEALANKLVQYYENNPIGISQSTAEEMWQYQGQDPTCMIATITGILRLQGVRNDAGDLITYPDVLFDIAQVKDHNGNILHNPQIVDLNGNPLYVVTIHLDRIPNLTFDINNITEVQTAYEALQFHLMVKTERAFSIQNPGNNASWGGIFDIMGHYDVPAHTGYAYSLYDITTELENRNALMVYVDPNEIWTSDFATREQQAFDGVAINGVTGTPINSGGAHMITITSLDLSDLSNPIAVINDSGPLEGSARRVPLVQVLAAMADYRFQYVAPNASVPEISLQQARRLGLERNLKTWYARHSNNPLVANLLSTSEYLLHAIQTPALMSLIEQDFGGTEQAAKDYLAQEIISQTKMLQKYNIPKGTIQNLYNNADVLEFSKGTIIDAIGSGTNKEEVRSLLDDDLLSRAGFTEDERAAVLNETYIRGLGHFTEAEIDEILGTDEAD